MKKGLLKKVRLKEVSIHIRQSLLFVLLVGSAGAIASTEAEREALSRLSMELETLDQFIHAAKKSSQKSDRQRFNYAQLRRDLALVRSGINQHLHRPRVDPRKLTPIIPLSGDYD
jgi:RAQPRD family integrative conjugative element protein